jgi:prepilin peptidase CpaA
MSLTETCIVVGKLLVFAGLISSAASDLARRIIPNWLVLAVGTGGVICRLATANWHGILAGAGAAGIVFAALRLLAGLGALGGGDFKLVAAVTLGEPVTAMMSVLLSIAVAGGVIALFYLVRQRLWPRGEGQMRDVSWCRREMPYGLAILAGVMWHEFWDLIT